MNQVNFKNIYLIDYENVGCSGFLGYDKLNNNDKVILFYSKYCSNIDIKTISTLLKNKVSIELISVFLNGSNSLDFQLVTYLGLIAKTYPNANYIIISNDSDYKSSIEMLSDLGYVITQQPAICMIKYKEKLLLKDAKNKESKNRKSKPKSDQYIIDLYKNNVKNINHLELIEAIGPEMSKNINIHSLIKSINTCLSRVKLKEDILPHLSRGVKSVIGKNIKTKLGKQKKKEIYQEIIGNIISIIDTEDCLS